MNPKKNDEPEEQSLPKAKIKEPRHISIIWVVPVLAAVVAGWLVYRYVEDAGPLIHIQFSDGSGIQANQTVVKYHGVRIGEVKSVKLAKDLVHVDVEVRLNSSAKNLACAESVFWIVRPEVGAGGFHGLETIVSGPFIQVQPGEGRPQKEFTGVDEPPILKQFKKGLEIILTTPQITMLSVGSPVYYRGIEVGAVEYFLLGTNATEDEIHVLIQPSYAPLVRTDTEFWNAGGVRVHVKLTGINISAGTFKSLIIGGIAFATPTSPGNQAAPDTVFKLNDKPDDKWLKWSPSIEIKSGSPNATQDSASSLLMNTLDAGPPDSSQE